MIGQGRQIFVDELERFATEVADSRCAAIARRLAAPLRVAVSGRRGVGRGTVARALARAADLRGTITLSTSPEVDVDVYVVAEVVKPEDRDAIAAADRPDGRADRVAILGFDHLSDDVDVDVGFR